MWYSCGFRTHVHVSIHSYIFVFACPIVCILKFTFVELMPNYVYAELRAGHGAELGAELRAWQFSTTSLPGAFQYHA